MRAPEDFDWWKWRPVLSTRIGASLREVSTWTLAEMAECHLALDLAEDLDVLRDRRLAPKAPR